MKRVVILSDFHCGHHVGLTPPKFNPKLTEGEGLLLYDTRQKYWDFFSKTIKSLQPIDILVVNGDLIDGKGVKSGGTEQITTDRNSQVDMAVATVKFCKANKIFMSYGTGYHTGNDEDWEKQVADECGADIHSRGWIDVNGLVFDYKHHIGGSQSPSGRLTPLLTEKIWSVLWAEHDEYPKAQVLVRSHVHYFMYGGGYNWLGITTPALQGYGSKFGARRMKGTVDFGLLSFDVTSKDDFSWDYHILKNRTAGSHVAKA